MENFKITYSRASGQWKLTYETTETKGKGKKKTEHPVTRTEWFPTESAAYLRVGEL